MSLHCKRIQWKIVPLIVAFAATALSFAVPNDDEGLDKVLTRAGYSGPHTLPVDRGASGLWQRMLKLGTIGSVLHVTAHPDDEHGGVLAKLSRGYGYRTAMLTLNRGEGGANAIGPELFDALGLIRTEELEVSNRYYGLDDQYYTRAVDYGFSKRLEEAFEKWGKKEILRDTVRAIRINRPLVVLSRFQGNERDGHGNHQAAGLVAREAFSVAGDPAVFPDQLKEGLSPWQPLKLYIGGVREDETWNVRVDAGRYSPWLGRSYQQFGWEGLSFQRSQLSGRRADVAGPIPYYYRRLSGPVEAGDRERSFFDGIDTSIFGLFSVTKEEPPPGATALLVSIERHLREAQASFNFEDPSAVLPALVRGLGRIRELLDLLDSHPESRFLLRIKERQFMEAIHAGLGLDFKALAVPDDYEPPRGPWAAFSRPPTMGPVVPGQTFRVNLDLTHRGHIPVALESIRLASDEDWTIRNDGRHDGTPGWNETTSVRFSVTVPEDASSSRPYFFRDSIRQDLYRLAQPRFFPLPHRPSPLVAVARYRILGETVELRETVRTREPDLPYGYIWRELTVAPVLAVSVRPEMGILPLQLHRRGLTVQVDLVNNSMEGSSGEMRLELPEGWTARPERHAFRFDEAGEQRTFAYYVTLPRLEERPYEVRAVATAGGSEYHEGYRVIRHRDLQIRQFYREAVAVFRGVDVELPSGMRVGYVMGVGDEVPAAIEQLGAEVRLLGERELAEGDLAGFDAIVVGTRAYAVRRDLVTYNRRLLDYAEDGGNLIVLYQTDEFVPDRQAPYPAQLPPRSEEVSEEDSPVKVLAPDHPLLHAPNRITLQDFDDWVEQRGSKFFSEWDQAYIPLIATWDQGQDPQKGGWLTARYGRGNYTYCAYAFHRQLPFAVPGAFRIFANLLALQ